MPVEPNDAGDWINRRDERYDTFQSIGDKAKKGKPDTNAVFFNFSNGLATSRDAWVVNYSSEKLWSNIAVMKNTFEESVEVLRNWVNSGEDPKSVIDKRITTDATQISWSRGLREKLVRRVAMQPRNEAERIIRYRPFSAQHAYFGLELVENMSQLPNFFPTIRHANVGIVMPSGNSAAAYSALVQSDPPALTPNGGNQFFPL